MMQGARMMPLATNVPITQAASDKAPGAPGASLHCLIKETIGQNVQLSCKRDGQNVRVHVAGGGHIVRLPRCLNPPMSIGNGGFTTSTNPKTEWHEVTKSVTA